METDTVQMLCNLYTREPLELMTEPNQDGLEDKFFVEVKTGERFPLINEIPAFYDVSHLAGYNLQYMTSIAKLPGSTTVSQMCSLCFMEAGKQSTGSSICDCLKFRKIAKSLKFRLGLEQIYRFSRSRLGIMGLI